MAEVELINVTKKVGPVTVLDGINLSIKKGEFMVVVGPSGCGKSTLLRLIAGLETLSSGTIMINAQCVNKIPAAKRDMAMVFQNYALYPHMTVFDNMAYALKMRGMNKNERIKRVNEVAEMLQLTPFLDRKPQALSGGQKQRVAMGRAMVRSPSVFLFDEPLSNLDAQLRTQMRHEIKRLHHQLNTTCLYVTHDQTEAMTMAERILVLNQGRIEQIGTPQELYQNPVTQFVAGFTGHYPINMLEAHFNKQKNTVHTEIGVDFPAPKWEEPVCEDSQLILAIRPEHIQICSPDTPEKIASKVEFIDDTGADKLIQVRTICSNVPLCLRIGADYPISEGNLYVSFPKTKTHIFLKKTGKRIGAWHE